MSNNDTDFDDDLLVGLAEAAEPDKAGQYEHWRITVDAGQQSVRIDKYLAEHMQHSSRNRIQTAAAAGCIQVNGKPVKSNYKIRPLDVITLMLDHPKHDSTILPEDIPLDIVYEDDDVMVVNKRAGMVVHPGAGNFSGTLINGSSSTRPPTAPTTPWCGATSPRTPAASRVISPATRRTACV